MYLRVEAPIEWLLLAQRSAIEVRAMDMSSYRISSAFLKCRNIKICCIFLLFLTLVEERRSKGNFKRVYGYCLRLWVRKKFYNWMLRAFNKVFSPRLDGPFLELVRASCLWKKFKSLFKKRIHTFHLLHPISSRFVCRSEMYLS